MTKPREEKIVGFGDPIGVFISKEELDQLKMAIRLRKPTSTTVTSDPLGGFEITQDEDQSIQDMVVELRKAYRLPEGKYGINKHGEFVWFKPVS